MSGFSFSIPPFWGRVEESADQIRLPQLFPVVIKAGIQNASQAKPVTLAQADTISPRRFPYELAGVTAFGKRLSLHAALPPNVFAQHAALRMARSIGLFLSGTTVLLTAACEGLAFLSPIDFQLAAESAVFGAYFMGAGIATAIFAQAGLFETAKLWRKEREFRSWHEATRVLPEKLGAAREAIERGIFNARASENAITAFEELAPYLDRNIFFQPIDFRESPPNSMRKKDVSFLLEAEKINRRGNPIPGPLLGASMIDEVDAAWERFGTFATVRLRCIELKLKTTRGIVCFELYAELGRYAKLATAYECHARRPSPWAKTLISILDQIPE